MPKILVFCAFAFDPEAAKDIDNIKGVSAIKAQMNTDLLTEDLKARRASNESFWLMGQPDVEVKKLKNGHYRVEVHGFDYFDTKTGELVSGGKNKIAMWELDTDYDDRWKHFCPIRNWTSLANGFRMRHAGGFGAWAFGVVFEPAKIRDVIEVQAI